MAYELNVRAEPPSPCWRCGREAAVSTREHIEDVVFLPLWRNVRRTQRCEHCQAWKKLPVSRAERAGYPRTAGVWRHIVISYAMLLGIVAGAIVCAVEYHAKVRAFADSPRIGDRWTVKADPWPDRIAEDSKVYAFARVDAVTEDSVTLTACSRTGAAKDADDCTTFGVPMMPVRRADVRRMFGDNVIDTIERTGHDFLPRPEIAGGLALLLALLVLHGWRSGRFFRA
jgi:hypothetical protein